MKKPGPIVVSDRLMAKMAAFVPEEHFNAAVFPPEADAALVKAREMGLTWEAIGDVFRGEGWPVNRQTLKKRWTKITGGQTK